MRVYKGHRIQLLPNNRQRTAFVRWGGAHRWAYNYGLARKIAAYEETGKSPGAYALMKEVVRLKGEPETAWLRDVPKSVPRMALLHLEDAYRRYFREKRDGTVDKRIAQLKAQGKWEGRRAKLMKAGRHGFQLDPGFPRFKSKKRDPMVFHLEPETVRVNGRRVWIPRLGWVKMTKPLRFSGKLVSTVAVREQAGKWYISFNVEVDIPDAVETQDDAVGVDLGVKALATLSDGTVFENPKAIRRLEGLLARAQRQLARKQKGSNRRKRARLRVARIQKRIADIRADATHKATRYLADRYGLVAMEDLHVSGMMKNHYLAKSVADANFGEFRRQASYKLAWAGGALHLVDRWFPSSKLCSACGCVNDKLTLADRVWACECGAIHDRDVNAAKNILAEALRARMVQTGLRVEATPQGGQ